MSYSFLCQVFYLSFSKAMALSCSNFVYNSWKSLFLQNQLECAEGRIDQFFKNRYRPIRHKFAIPAF